MFSPEDLILILAVALLLFGANKLPEMARSLGKATGEFKKGQLEAENELRQMKKPLDDQDTKIHKLAVEIDINDDNKTTEQLIEEICTKIKSN